MLRRVSAALAGEGDVATIIHPVVTACHEWFGFEHVAVGTIEGDFLVNRDHVGLHDAIPRLPLSSGDSGRVARTGVPAFIHDVSADPDYVPLGDDVPMRSTIVVPLWDRGPVAGVLVIETVERHPRHDDDFFLATTLAEHVGFRPRNLILTRLLYRRLETHNRALEVRVSERTVELEQAQQEVLDRLALAAEYRDDQTGRRTRRVARGSSLLAAAMGLSAVEADLIGRAAPPHDVGKIGISDQILLKPTDLTQDKFGAMRTHATIGTEILGRGHSPLLRMAEEIALTHQEHRDGSVYPRGLASEGIPIASRIVTVIDVFDALLHERPYKKAWRVTDAIRYIHDHSGVQFDPAVVTQFLRLCETRMAELLVDPAPEIVVAPTEIGLHRR